MPFIIERFSGIKDRGFPEITPKPVAEVFCLADVEDILFGAP